jgi:hypothetical protein
MVADLRWAALLLLLLLRLRLRLRLCGVDRR